MASRSPFGFFNAPVVWFAILVRICSADIHKTLDYLLTTRLLGKLDESHVDDVPWMVKHYNCFTTPEIPSAYREGKLPAMGFWLPQTFDDLSGFGRRWHRRYS